MVEQENRESRLNEWVEYQELGVESKIVEVEEVGIDEDTSNVEKRGWWKRFKKRVRKGFRKLTLTDCRKTGSHHEIDGVTDLNGMNDRWGREVTIWNEVNYCTPTAAAMVMQYDVHIRRNKPSLYINDVNTIGRSSDTNPYVAKWAYFLKSGKNAGTNAWYTYWYLPYRIYDENRRNGLSGWAYSYYTTVWNRGWQFHILKKYINRDNPCIYHAPANTISGQDDRHSMPVVGYKSESYSGWCAKRIWPNKNWLLVDTESWRGTKSYVRFDSRSNYWKFGAISYIWSH